MKCVLVLLFLGGWFLKLVQSHGHEGKHVHVKFVVPVYKHNHHHTHTVYKHPPPPPPKIIVHEHHHHHDHGHKHGHDHNHHHKDLDNHHCPLGWDVHDWSEHSSFSSSGGGDEDYRHNSSPSEPFQEQNDQEPKKTDKSHKSLKVESFQLSEAKDSSAFDPVHQHYVTGSYGEGTKLKVHKVFQAPLADIKVHQTGYEDDLDENDYGEPNKQPDPYELEPLRQFFQNENQI